MTRQSRLSLVTKDSNRRRKKFMGGEMTATEAHQKYAFPLNAKCSHCSARPLNRTMVFMPLQDAIRQNSALEQLAIRAPGMVMEQVVQFKGTDGRPEPYFRCSVTYWCKACSPQMERTAAKAPSYCVVEITKAPQEDKIISSGAL